MTARIDIWYQTSDSDIQIHRSFNLETYFDSLEEGETFTEHGIPRFNFTWQYIDVPPDQLVWSIERRTGTSDDTTFSTQYFDGGKSWVNHRTDPSGYEELIHAIDLGESYLTLRSAKQPNGRWLAHTALISDSKTDTTLYTFPEGTFSLAATLSLRLAKIANGD
ncbi:MAG: hypothetical protein RLZZ04_3680 [Cyanobacteriota bacterium]|jgi:hypothetical protein